MSAIEYLAYIRRKRRHTLFLSFLAPLALVSFGDLGDKFKNAIYEFFGWLWDIFKEYIGEPIAQGVRNVIGSFFNGLKDLFGSLWNAIAAPFDTLRFSWFSAFQDLRNVLGNFSFLTPIIIAVLAVITFIVVWVIIKYLTPA